MRASSDLWDAKGERNVSPESQSPPVAERATEMALAGRMHEARDFLRRWPADALSPREHARLLNDLAALEAVGGDLEAAAAGFQQALAVDATCASAQLNQERLRTSLHVSSSPPTLSTSVPTPRRRIAILSLLFNWPSTGGGTIHTYEAAQFLQRDGYEVRHFYAQYDEWGLGQVTEPLAVESQALHFSAEAWRPDEIRRRFRAAVDEFAPERGIDHRQLEHQAAAGRGRPRLSLLLADRGVRGIVPSQ